MCVECQHFFPSLLFQEHQSVTAMMAAGSGQAREVNVDANAFIIPSVGDRVRFRGLVSAGHLNGEEGIVRRYVGEQQRYQMKVLSVNQKATIAVKRNNFDILVTNDDPHGSSTPSRKSMHVIIPCHLADEHRFEQFMQCAKSVGKQTERNFCAFVSISSPYAQLRFHAGVLLQMLNDKRPGVRWYVLDDASEGKAQFEHIRDLLELSDSIDRDAWLMFLDNDDMFHPQRVGVFRREAERRPPRDPDRVAFNCGNKLLLDSDIIGDNKLDLDELVTDDGKSEPWREDKDILHVTQLALGDEVEKLDAAEYFDFCVHASILRRFLELTPDELLAHNYCDVRFAASLVRHCVTRCTYSGWLIAHFKLRLEMKTVAFHDDDVERYARHASAHVGTVTEEERQLAEQTGLPPEKIVSCRSSIEEQVIMFYGRDDCNLKGARERMVNEINENCGHNLGSILWDRACEKFALYFSEQLEDQNKRWCQEGRAPYVALDYGEYRDEIY